jgi:hypothetical protein
MTINLVFVHSQIINVNIAVVSWREYGNFQWNNDEVRFVLDQHTGLEVFIVLMKHTNITSKANLQQLVGHISLFFPIQHCEKKLKAQSIMKPTEDFSGMLCLRLEEQILKQFILDSRPDTRTTKDEDGL